MPTIYPKWEEVNPYEAAVYFWPGRATMTRVTSRIRELREALQVEASDPSQWTQKAVAEKVPVSERAYHAWEAGEYPPTGWRLKRLARVLGVSVDDLAVEDAK